MTNIKKISQKFTFEVTFGDEMKKLKKKLILKFFFSCNKCSLFLIIMYF